MIHIDEMVLRVPGFGEEESRRFGELVTQRLTARLPEQARDQHLDALGVRLSVSPGMDQSQMADEIVEQILRQLNIALR